jgi:nicotinamide phosphoribosyltransferase
MSFETNFILDTDSYKFSHWLQYPPGTQRVFSYIESRGGEYEETVFFGLQYILRKYFSKPITMNDIQEADEFCEAHGVPFNKDGWVKIVQRYKGRLPLHIRAVPEGTVVPTHNILVSVENTDLDMFWLTSVIETMMVRLWYPINVATISRECKKVMYKALVESSENPDAAIDFMLHDFGSRGVSSRESAAIGGTAHLVNFKGSDTVVGVLCANHYYNTLMAGFSIPAAEHSTTTSWGRENETEAYRNMLRQFAAPGKLVAVVSDSYDIYNACANIWGGELRQEVIDSGATVVIRPDSGDPVTVVLKVLGILAAKFGYRTNDKGYKVLKYVKVIQGDGVNIGSISDILESALAAGYSAENLAFGMGGALLQMHNRDTQRFAMKCSHIVCDGESRDVYKKPITDPGKDSKKGRLDLVKTDFGNFKTITLGDDEPVHKASEMKTVYLNGELYNVCSLEEVRELAKLPKMC